MNRQALITKPVIDSRFFAAQIAGMLTHDEIRAELIRQIDNGDLKQVDVARHLCIAPARISEIKRGTRRVQPDEMPRLATLLKLTEPSAVQFKPIGSSERIPNLGKVAQGVWLEQSMLPEGFVAYDSPRQGDDITDLFAVTPEGKSMNLRFNPDTQLICRRVLFGSAQYRSGDYVIAERSAHDLRELTCKRLEIDREGVHWLHSESDDPVFSEPWRIGKPNTNHHDDTEVRIVAKVVRAVQDFENV